MSVQLTQSAIDQLLSIKNSTQLYPRIEIVAGGCNGFEKRFSTSKLEQNDYLVADVLLIDPTSYEFLSNSQIDYKVDITGGNFVIDIPESTSTCGCGVSFSI